MSDWTQLIETGFQKLSELGAKYGPQAIDTAAQVVRIDAAQNVVEGVIGALVGAGSAVVIWRHLRGCREFIDFNPAIVIPCALGALFGTIAGLVNLFNVWTWVALSDPRMALAAKIVHALPGMGQ